MDVRIRDSGDLKRFARDLRRHADGKALKRELIKSIRKQVKPVADQIKKAYRSHPSNTPSSERSRSRQAKPSLRRSLAKATRTQIRLSGKDAGIRLRVDGRKMPDGMKNLPKRVEGTGRWRVPVFGNEEVWVSRQSWRVFYPRVRALAPKVGRSVEEVAADLARKLSKG